MNNKALAILFTVTLALFTAIMAAKTTPNEMQKKQRDTWTHTMDDYLEPRSTKA